MLWSFLASKNIVQNFQSAVIAHFTGGRGTTIGHGHQRTLSSSVGRLFASRPGDRGEKVCFARFCSDIKGDRLCQCVTGTGSNCRRHFGTWRVSTRVNQRFSQSTAGSACPVINKFALSGVRGAESSQLVRQFADQSTTVKVQHSGTIPGLAAAADQRAEPAKMTSKEFKRLPINCIPQHYTLELRPDLVAFKFAGKAKVQIQILQPTDSIVLNALDIEISKTRLQVGETYLLPIKILLSPEQEIVSLFFDGTIPVGPATLEMKFTGELNDKMKGFYRSKYFNLTGDERYAAVTQFEATDARRCFPCWDEPAIKATFDISLVVPVNRVALSNMPVKSEEVLDQEKMLVHFERTPVMSTYLVAVVVGEYDYVEGTSSDGVLVRVYTPVGKKNQGLFALDVATKVLPYYKEYFNIAYPLPKMDLIAIADFSAGAMENWGLVTYRETFVLVDPENTSLIRKQSIALTIGHEIAHQWFGNLVTMEWWTHLWLNEGYASFVEFLCVNHLFPEFDIWTQFATDMYIRALELDCLKNSHPIEVPVDHPSEIDEIFDEISYNKGASVIRMLHYYIGDEDFRKGMNLYLTRHQYKNTKTEDLWDSLERASKKPIAQVMSTWVQQMGFPMITVESVQMGSKRVLDITQEKFTADGSICTENYFWMIPITVSTSNNPTAIVKSLVLDKKTVNFALENVSENHWVKINIGTVGYYRTKYSQKMLTQLIPAIRDMSLPPLDRLGLVDDLFALVQAGHASTVQVLKLIDAFKKETNYTVWSAITNSLTKLQILLSHTELSHHFNGFGIRLYGPVAARLGWDAKPEESHLDTLLRGLVLNKLISFRCPKTILEAKKRFKDHTAGRSALPADLRSACYKAVLQEGDNDTFEHMLKLYRSTDLHEEKDRISRALGSIQNIGVLKKVIQFAVSDEVRAQDSIFVIVAVAMNPKGRDMTWGFFKENSDKLLDQYQGGFLLARLIKHLTENFASEEKAKEVEAFFKENEFPGAERTVQQSIETIRLNAAWLGRDLAATTEYLTSKPSN